jgi:nanoRNase/pAp phosphatase (c-di-AMP/oligoRNAs hydrolase)
MPVGSLVQIIWGISFQNSYRVQKGDIIVINGHSRRVEHKEDSVVYVEPFSGSTTEISVNFLSK